MPLAQEKFDEFVVRIAHRLGLHHIEHLPNDPTCNARHLGRAAQLPPSSGECEQKENMVAKCAAVSASRKRCLASFEADCQRIVREVAPADYWLYEQSKRLWADEVGPLGDAFQAELVAYRRKSVGMWRGGTPTIPPCIIKNTASQNLFHSKGYGGSYPWAMPDMPASPCNPLPQALGEAVYLDTKRIGNALIVPNNATCRDDPYLCIRARMQPPIHRTKLKFNAASGRWEMGTDKSKPKAASSVPLTRQNAAELLAGGR